jgi:hypothetical protein
MTTPGARGVDGPIRPNATVAVEPLSTAVALVAKGAPASHQRLKELLEGTA